MAEGGKIRGLLTLEDPVREVACGSPAAGDADFQWKTWRVTMEGREGANVHADPPH